jgi:hypothetical protein
MTNSDKPYIPDWRNGLRAANAAPRCGAKTRRRGTPCQSPGMKNGRCRIHGGKSTGPKTPEGIERIRKSQWKHGLRSAETIRQRKKGAAVRREIKRLAGLAKSLLDG